MAGPEDHPVESPRQREARELVSSLKRIERRGTLGSLGQTQSALELVHRISGVLNQFFHDFDSAMRHVIDMVLEVTGAMRGALLLFDDADELAVVVARTAEGEEIPADQIEIPPELLEEVLHTRAGVYVSDLAQEGKESSADTGEFRITSALGAPLRYADSESLSLDERREDGAASRKVLGVVYVDSQSLASPLTREGLLFLEAIANHATTALRNARVYMEATRDSLTGLAIRRVFENRVAEEIRAAEKEGGQVSLLMTDLDHFKQVNDTFGHPVGDEVLRLAAVAARQSVRTTDLVARYGGEEFALILPRTRAGEAYAVAEKIRLAVSRLTFANGRGRITISVGVAEYPSHAETGGDLVLAADKALYAAKQKGRNRTVVWSDAVGAETAREDKLAGILTGDWAKDYRNVSLLLETLDLINAHADLAGTVKAVMQKMVEITDADRGLMLLGDADDLDVFAALDKTGRPLARPVRFSHSVVKRVFDERAPLAIVDTIDDLEGAPTPESVLNLEIRSMMCAPLEARGRRLGAMYVDSRRRAQGFLPGDLAFFDALAKQIASVLERRIE